MNSTNAIGPSQEEIQQAIPHRAPMLLIDKIVSRTENSIVCEKTFKPEEFFLQGHYPDFPIVPGVILCECAAQAGAILLSQKVSADDGVPVLTRMNDVKFKTMVQPGDTIEIQATLDDVLSNAFFLTGQVKVSGKLALRLTFACSLAKVGKNPP
jgi:3-hydroxyacyl-[acyl-carrier-protein] dehydratase